MFYAQSTNNVVEIPVTHSIGMVFTLNKALWATTEKKRDKERKRDTIRPVLCYFSSIVDFPLSLDFSYPNDTIRIGDNKILKFITFWGP